MVFVSDNYDVDVQLPASSMAITMRGGKIGPERNLTIRMWAATYKRSYK